MLIIPHFTALKISANEKSLYFEKNYDDISLVVETEFDKNNGNINVLSVKENKNEYAGASKATVQYSIPSDYSSMDSTETMADAQSHNSSSQYSLPEVTPSPELKSAIERFSNDEDVSNEELESIPQIRELLDEVAKRPETYTIDTIKRRVSTIFL